VPEPPVDVEAYWRRVDEDLAAQPMLPVLEVLPRHSSECFTVFALRLTSIGPYRLYGYLSVPAGTGPFPALLEVPRYGSVNSVPHWNDRLRYVVLTIMHRGQRLADQPYAAAYPGLLTEGIEDPRDYVYRSIVADCLRAAELLAERPEVDPKRVGLRGNDLALLIAARRPRFKAVDLESTFFYRVMEARRSCETYPIEELNDYLRVAPASEVAVERTLELFDPLYHARSVRATTLIGVGDEGGLDGRDWLAPLFGALGAVAVSFGVTYKGGVDGDLRDDWLARQLGAEPMSRFRRDLP
jgi:cephalosporin-C deacetylase